MSDYWRLEKYWKKYWENHWTISPNQSLKYEKWLSDIAPLKKKEAEGMSWSGMDFKRVWFDDKLHMSTIDATLIYKKEEAKQMKTKMNEATIQALHKSIAHWNDICYGMEKNIGVSRCALCSEFNRSYLQCGGCPLMQSMQCCYNDQSAYGKYASIRRGFCTVDSADAAEAMLELLVSLLPEDKIGPVGAKNHDIYTPYLPGDPKHEYYIWGTFKNWWVPTGITADGRNAFPQAKYVWEKVFAKQAPLTATDIKAMWEEFGRPIGIRPIKRNWDPNAPKVRDGKCVTCGQVVRKKVTKYKVVIGAARSEEDVAISDYYYESEADFNSQSNLNHIKFIHLIKETAKEFDA